MRPTTQTQLQKQARGSSYSSFAVVWIADVFAWAAKRNRPTLENRALIVSDSNRVVGCDESLRQLGVRVGDPLGRARGLAPDAVVVPFEATDSSSAWAAALAAMQDYSPWLESPHMGLAYLAQLDAQQAESLALELQARVGLAASRGTALIAATAAKAKTVNVVTNESAFLEAAPAYLLRVTGLSEATLEKLRLFGLDTLGKIARLSLRQLEAQFGTEASRLVALSAGSCARV